VQPHAAHSKLINRLNLSTAFHIQPLTDEQINDYLGHGNPDLQAATVSHQLGAVSPSPHTAAQLWMDYSSV
jgi:hypothetical protein